LTLNELCPRIGEVRSLMEVIVGPGRHLRPLMDLARPLYRRLDEIVHSEIDRILDEALTRHPEASSLDEAVAMDAKISAVTPELNELFDWIHDLQLERG
jgi:hypothetical protein